MNSQHHFVFVGGLQRSGTTLLFRMLREHPAISGFANNPDPDRWLAMDDEGEFLQSVYPPALCWGGPGRFAFAPEAHMTEESELLTPENKQKLAKEWSQYWDLSKPYLLEKSPPNLIWTRFLQSAFPNSSFVIIVRHPVAVSLATEKWCPESLSWLVEHWLVAHEILAGDRPYLQRVITVNYESLVAAPAATLGAIYEFLGLRPHPTHFEFNGEHNQRYFAEWLRRARNPDISATVEECIAQHEQRVRALGYSLVDLETREGERMQSAAAR
jgi:Sulfotransferase family